MLMRRALPEGLTTVLDRETSGWASPLSALMLRRSGTTGLALPPPLLLFFSCCSPPSAEDVVVGVGEEEPRVFLRATPPLLFLFNSTTSLGVEALLLLLFHEVSSEKEVEGVEEDEGGRVALLSGEWAVVMDS
jgi:hypothetical protein